MAVEHLITLGHRAHRHGHGPAAYAGSCRAARVDARGATRGRAPAAGQARGSRPSGPTPAGYHGTLHGSSTPIPGHRRVRAQRRDGHRCAQGAARAGPPGTGRLLRSSAATTCASPRTSMPAAHHGPRAVRARPASSPPLSCSPHRRRTDRRPQLLPVELIVRDSTAPPPTRESTSPVKDGQSRAMNGPPTHEPRSARPAGTLLRGINASPAWPARPRWPAARPRSAAGIANTELDPGTVDYWNLFGGGDGVRMQQMEDGYRKANPETRAAGRDARLGQPLLHQAGAGHRRAPSRRTSRCPT